MSFRTVIETDFLIVNVHSTVQDRCVVEAPHFLTAKANDAGGRRTGLHDLEAWIGLERHKISTIQ